MHLEALERLIGQLRRANPSGFYLFTNSCGGVATTALALRVWDSLGRQYPMRSDDTGGLDRWAVIWVGGRR